MGKPFLPDRNEKVQDRIKKVIDRS